VARWLLGVLGTIDDHDAHNFYDVGYFSAKAEHKGMPVAMYRSKPCLTIGFTMTFLLPALTIAQHPADESNKVRTCGQPDTFGNAIPDFSLAGYRNGGVALPVAPVVETLNPAVPESDDTVRIQAAIDRVAMLPRRPGDGVRGAVLLTQGAYRCGSSVRVPPGVTLRGQGQGANGTVITAAMTPTDGGKPTLICIEGEGSVRAVGESHRIVDKVVPLGAHLVRVNGANAFRAGDLVLLQRASTQQWIHDLKMDQIRLGAKGKQWQPRGYRVAWYGRVVAVQDDALTLDAPVMCSLEQKYGGGVVRKAEDVRGEGAAVENLRLVSVYAKGQETADESHAWIAISIAGVVDSWVREVTALHFANSCVHVGKNAARITVQDCAMIDPVSRISGARRYSFVGSGPYVFFQRCYARNGRHDFVTGHLDVGPTVFLDCLAERTHADIGPHHRWACGQLYDSIKGGAINVQDRGGAGTGHGWAGNCQVLWNCEGSSIICQQPWMPSAQNWAVGCIGAKGRPAVANRPDGNWESAGVHVVPRSLYLAQLKSRFDQAGGKGDEAVRAITTPEQRQGNIWDYLRRRYGSGTR
jgi:hypothetical protein